VQLAADRHAIACHIPLEELRKVEPVFSTLNRDLGAAD
jgi:hypothetical protein